MKKIFASVCALALVLVVGLGFAGCKKQSSMDGVYSVRSAEAMGLSATAESFRKYAESRSAAEKEGNSLYNALQVIMNTQITIKGNNVSLRYVNFKSLLENDPHYSDTYNKALANGYVTANGDLLIDDLSLFKDDTEADCYYLYRVDSEGNILVDENGQIRGLMEIWGVKFTKVDCIRARIKNNQIAFRFSVVQFEREGERAQSGFSTSINIYMSK